MTFFIPLLLAAALSSGNAEFDDVARKGASEIAVARARAEIAVKGPEQLDLKGAMLAKPADYANAAAAKVRCRALYADAVQKEYTVAVEAIRKRLGIKETDPIALTEAEITQAMKGFEGAFGAARKQACEEQAKQIVLTVRPTVAEFDGADEQKLRGTMATRIAASQKMPIFEENHRFISEHMVQPVIDAARKERRRQEDYVRRVRSEGCAPSVLKRDISEKLVANVRERAAAAKDPVQRWDVFPSVTNRTLQGAVERRIVERFAQQTADVEFAPKSEEIGAAILADRTQHRLVSESERNFRTAFGAKLISAALTAVIASAPKAEQEELRAFVVNHMTDKSVLKAANVRMDVALIPAWREARTKVVMEEFAKRWPLLADRTWYPTCESADEICTRSDYSRVIRGWRDLPTCRNLDNGIDAFEESAKLADASVMASFEIARAAIAAQLKIVDDVEETVLKEARERKESFFQKTPDLKAIVGLLTDATEKTWSRTKMSTLWAEGEEPKNAKEQHAQLFPTVKKRIELVAKSILEQIQDPKPEEPPEETPPEEEKPEEMLYTISVTRNGDAVEVKLEQGKKTLVERKTRAEMGDFREAMKALSERLGGEILKLK